MQFRICFIMPDGLTELIERLEQTSQPQARLTVRKFIDALHYGVETEPDKFSFFIERLGTVFYKHYASQPEERRRTIFFRCLAIYAGLADYFHRPVIHAPRVQITGSTNVFYLLRRYIESPEQYGSVMRAVSDHFQLKGKTLADYLLREKETIASQ